MTQIESFVDKVSRRLRWLEVPVSENERLTVLKNPDLQPIPLEDQKWGVWSNAMYWSSCAFAMGTWLGGSSGLTVGLSYGETLGCFALGNFVTLIFTLFNGMQGVNWKVGFTIGQRLVFGIYGSGLGVCLRILFSIVNYGSSAWLGGLTVNMIISSWSKTYFNLTDELSSSVPMTVKELIGFLIFHALCAVAYFLKPRKMNYIFIVGCFLSVTGMLSMIIYLTAKTGGVGESFKSSTTTISGSKKSWAWVYMISYWFGSVSPAATNQSDYSRFASSKKGFILGTCIGLTIPPLIVPFFGIVGASTSTDLYGEAYWTPMAINDQWLSDGYTAGARAASFFLGLAFTVAQLGYTVSSSGFAGGMDLAGVLPRFIDIKRGSLLTAAISFAVQPWNFYLTSSNFLTVMYCMGVVMTPIISIMVCDNFIIRKQQYAISEAFKVHGEYYFTYGVNWRAMLSFVLAMTPGIPGMVWAVNPNEITDQGIINFYYADSFTSFAIAFFSYWIMCVIFPLKIRKPHDTKDYYHSFSDDEARKKGIIPFSELADDEINEHNLSSQSSTNEWEKSEEINVEVIEKPASETTNTYILADKT